MPPGVSTISARTFCPNLLAMLPSTHTTSRRTTSPASPRTPFPTGAMSAPSMPTTRPTWTCVPSSLNSTFIIASGHCGVPAIPIRPPSSPLTMPIAVARPSTASYPADAFFPAVWYAIPFSDAASVSIPAPTWKDASSWTTVTSAATPRCAGPSWARTFGFPKAP